MASVFIQERLQQALEGWSYTPTVDAVLNAPKSKQVTAPPVEHPAGIVHSDPYATRLARCATIETRTEVRGEGDAGQH